MSKSTPSQEIAAEILSQLGGRPRLSTMTGANTFLAVENGLQFKFKLYKKANTCIIKLDGCDTYTVQFWKITKKTCKVFAEHKGIYANRLAPLFQEQTGLHLRLFDTKTERAWLGR